MNTSAMICLSNDEKELTRCIFIAHPSNKDTWWRLESLKEGVILAQRPPGWYNERFELMSVVEKIPIFGKDHQSSSSAYQFTIGDSYPCQENPSETWYGTLFVLGS